MEAEWWNDGEGDGRMMATWMEAEWWLKWRRNDGKNGGEMMKWWNDGEGGGGIMAKIEV